MSKFNTVTDGMTVVDISEAEGGYNYYGQIRPNGEWLILREKEDGTEYRVALGASGYSVKWSSHTSLTYTLPIIN